VDFVPHTADDDRAMLDAIGAADMAELFEPVPAALRLTKDLDVPPALSEVELIDHVTELAAKCSGARDLVCFAGGGAYDHHVPAAARALASRAEFATSYTPYQPELSQGVLQAIYEFQTIVCELYGMDVANASLYDGASALVESVNMAVRITGRHKVIVGETVHPHHRAVLETSTKGLGLEIVTEPMGDGAVAWDRCNAEDAAAVVVAYPNFFGRLEDIARAADRAHASGALAIASCDPTAMGILTPPGEVGFDIAVGEGYALGNATSYGGPWVGLFATKAEHVRQVPGRIAGVTTDADGRRAYVLTLQAREQHIRRAKATSNVCTNQTLMAIAATIHLSWLGPHGLARLGEVCARRTAYAARRLADIPGCSIAFDGPRFKEMVLKTPVDGSELVKRLARRGYLAGPALGRYWPEHDHSILIAVTERRTADDIDSFAEAIEKELTE
jgi:glycine dehydrogenase subunit 1